MSGKAARSEKAEKRDRSRERRAAKSPSGKSDVSMSSSASNAVASSTSDYGAPPDYMGGTSSPAPSQEPSELSRSISPRSKKAKKVSQSSITVDGSPLLREKLNSRSSSAGPSSGSASHESSSSPAPPFNIPLKSSRTGSYDQFVSYHYGSTNQFFAVPSSPSGRSNLYNGGTGQALQENGEEAELVTRLWADFQGQVAPALDTLVKRNKHLRTHVSVLLKASAVEEAPYMALAREKDALSREYDQLRFEHLQLHNDFLMLRREHIESVALAQRLQNEVEMLRSGQDPSSGSFAPHNSENLSSSDFSAQASSGLSVSQGSATHHPALQSQSPHSTPRSTSNGYITGTSVYGVASPYSISQLTTSSASDVVPSNGAMSSPRPFADPSAHADSITASGSSPVLSSSSPRLHIRRKDNVAELEQSILELEEEIRSPRAPPAASPTPEPRPDDRHTTPNERHTRKSSSETPTKGKERRGSGERDPTSSTHLVTSKSKRKVPKSHSNDPPNTHSVNSANGGGPPSNPGSPSPTSSSGRVKAPPERNVSAPSNQAKWSSVNSGSSGTPSGSPHVSRGDKPHSSSQPSSASSTAGHIGSPGGAIPKDSIALNSGASSASNNSASRVISAEDREEQRLAKYMGGFGAVRRTNTPKQNNSRHSSGSGAPAVSVGEQSAFTALFKHWDENDDGVIERAEFEAAVQAMADNDQLKELASAVLPYISKVHWDEVGLSTSAPISLAAALAFLSDCKLGHPSTSVFQFK